MAWLHNVFETDVNYLVLLLPKPNRILKNYKCISENRIIDSYNRFKYNTSSFFHLSSHPDCLCQR